MPRHQAINLKYKKIGTAYRPIIAIEVQYAHNTESCLVLVDSGADDCVFDADFGELLGINIKTGTVKEFGGIASDSESVAPKMISGYQHTVGITVGGITRNTSVYFTYDLADWGYSIVGQSGFFDKFDSIKFDYTNKRITIRP